MPVLQVALLEPTKGLIIRAVAQLDTGADFVFFGTQYADAIGVDWKRAPRLTFGGIGSAGNDGYAVDLRLIVTAGRHGWPARIVFSPIMNTEPFPLLGREGFLDHCEARFNTKKRQFHLKA